jgi:MFS family permease
MPVEAQQGVGFGMSRRAQGLRYVTRHFDDLQGLITAPMAAAILISILGAQVGKRADFWWNAPLVLAPLLAWLAAGWYRSQYGRIVEEQRSAAARLWPALTLAIVVLALLVLRGRFAGLTSSLALTISVIPLFLLKAWAHTPPSLLLRLRRWLNGIAALVLLASGLAAEWPRHGAEPGREWLSYFAATALMLSLYDHWLLGHLLQQPPEGKVRNAH